MAVSRDKFGWERLSDIQVPRGVLWLVLSARLYRQHQLSVAIDEFGHSASELAEYLGNSWRESQRREARLVELQASMARMTKWLIALTVLLGLIGLGGIAVTIWATLQ